jgi:predicted pyridoxine 5'-phosphate oxidase superfamily flavin-nucleotide-binding protein
MSDSPFHAGESALQQRAGVREKVEGFGRRMLRDHMPEQHRELFAKLPTLLVGSLDAQGRPWASMLIGRPGFISTPDDRQLRVAAVPGFGDPLRAHLAEGNPLGLLGLEPHTRRRNRMNGTLTAVDAAGFTVQVDQSFGNCPQYIQAREPEWVDDPAAFGRARPVAPEAALLSLPGQRLVARSDTLFVASAAPQARGHAGADGVDVSHRGGKPGFVQHTIEGNAAAACSVLTIPDFRGNFLFQTLGNIVAYPRAGLLFADPGNGDVLQLTGSAEVIWDGPQVEAFAGAQRLLRVRVEQGWWMPAALPLRWSALEYASQLAATGTWA